MFILEDKEKLISRSKKIARHSVLVSFAVFVLSFLVSAFLADASARNILGDISVLSVLFFVLSIICLFLIQVEVWEKEEI